jgi:DNA-binding PadR family transcriptional regulator
MGWLSYHKNGARGLTRVRITRGRRRMLLALLSEADNLHPRRLGKAAGVWPGTLYPFLDHLELAGWVDKHRQRVGFESKYCYTLTDEGRMRAAAELCLILPMRQPDPRPRT